MNIWRISCHGQSFPEANAAYELIRQLNDELEQAGYLVIRGRVSRKYYLERTYGGIESEASQ